MIKITEKFFNEVYKLSRFIEEKTYPYLRDIMPFILQDKKFSNEEISKINRRIIESDRNVKNYADYFEKETIEDFQEKTKDASIELIERCSSNNKTISMNQQHLIITFIDDYLSQIQELKKQKIINYSENFVSHDLIQNK